MPRLIDIKGQVFGLVTVLERSSDNESKSRRDVCWLCQCQCGNKVTFLSRTLRKRGPRASCGCASFLKRDRRICKGCGREFWFQRCYSKRQHRAGSFCTRDCRISSSFKGLNNPNAGPLCAYGSRVVRQTRQLECYQEFRVTALQHLATLYNLSSVRCMRCGCPNFKTLQVNHKIPEPRVRNKRRREVGVYLWRRIPLLSNEELLKRFNILCTVCNYTDFVEKKFKESFFISYRGEGASSNEDQHRSLTA